MTTDYTSAQIKDLAIHRVGNFLREEGYFLSKRTISVKDTAEHDLLLKYFTGSFKTPEFFQFTHPTEVTQNDIYHLCERLFSRKIDLLEFSSDAAKLLYSKSTHPKVNGGELYAALLNNVSHDGETIQAIALFKSENKTAFMKVEHETDIYHFEFEEGISLNEIDKACIILNIESEDGYRVCIHDRQGKGEEAMYWKHEFLGLKPCADSYHQTRQFLSLCKNYIKDQLPQEFEVEKTDQIDMLNKSVAYFKDNEQFDYDSFTRSVIQEPHLMNSFGRYKEEFAEKNSLSLGDDFEISPTAVKSQSRIFKSVIKLDKNFHLYVHGNKEMIERGYDEQRGLNYYKVYFREES